MKLKTNVGQIFLNHPLDGNFTSVYEETFSKQGQSVDLFAVIEITAVSSQTLKINKPDYEKLARTIVSALKRTYIAAAAIGEYTFEKALANINSSLSRLGSKEKITWFGRLNAAVGAVSSNEFSLSTTGNAVVYLKRDGDLSALSEDLPAGPLKPTKLFSNFSSGGLAPGDRVVLSNRELLNFLSLARLEGFLAEPALEDVCAEIIAALADVKDTGVAAYVFETYSGEKPAAPPPGQVFQSRLRPKNLRSAVEIAKYLITSAAGYLWRVCSAGAKFVIHFFRVRPKKYIFIAIAIVLIIFLGNIALASWRKSGQSIEQDKNAITAEIDQKLSAAESALIYDNENGAINLLTEIEALLQNLGEESDARPALEQRLQDLKNKVSKEARIDNLTVLTTFPSVPTHLVHSPNGFLAFNKNSGRLAFYDFREGRTKQVLQNQNTGNLAFGLYLGSVLGYVFLDKDGRFHKLDAEAETLAEISSAPNPELPLSDLGHIRNLTALGENANARLYGLDHKNQQIWRLNVSDVDISAPERWLKTTANFAESRDLAVDGSVYVLYPDGVDKYFNGSRQTFQLSAASPPVKNLAGIAAGPELQAIYLLDPDNKRVLVMSKQGQLQKQIISDKLRDLSDIFVDEKTGLLYALSGSELLQINLK